MNNIDPNTTKYKIIAKINADGIVEKPDVVGAIFGQTEGLLGEELDLRDLQKSGRIGRIEVEITSKGGKSEGNVYVSSSLDQVETAILASALETIDRVGPCKAGLKVLGIEDVRISKREQVIDRAKELLNEMIKQGKGTSAGITDTVRQSIQVEEITTYGKDRCPAGPGIKDAESIIIVEGRSDVLNLLRAGIKNSIAVEGTNIPETVQEISREKVATAFVDGDRGGELILKELFQVAEIDFVARAPRAHEVEELTSKMITKCLRNKVPADQYMELNKLLDKDDGEEKPRHEPRPAAAPAEERPRRNGRDSREQREPRADREQREPRGDRDAKHEPRFSRESVDKYRKETSDSEDAEEKPRRTRTEEKSEDAEEKPARNLRGPRKAKEPKNLSPEQEKFRDMLSGLASTHNAKVTFTGNDQPLEVAVKELVDYLKGNTESVDSIVFDGVVSQRIVDVADDKNIPTIVGTRKGNITKMPSGIVIWTKEDLF